MKIKILEIRDEGTEIAVAAIQMLAENVGQAFYVHGRCGHPKDGSSIVVMCLDDMRATNDPYEWASLGKGPRTLPVAHDYIIDHFVELNDGDVVDVQHILGETPTRKISSRLVL